MKPSTKTIDCIDLLTEVRACDICVDNLPYGSRPIVQLSQKSKILIAGQAPGRRVHESGIPFNDASGDRLRSWMGISKKEFYDATKVALLPMGFCYPGTGKSGDLPPRLECAEAWREPLLAQLSEVKLTLVIGQYALDYHLDGYKGKVTDAVKSWQDYWPDIVPLPHPSPRNNLWLRKNLWFEKEIIPALQKRIASVLG